MTQRERILGGAVAGLFVLAGGYLGVTKLLIGRAEQLDTRIAGAAERLERLTAKNDRMESAARAIRGWAALTFDDEPLRASAKLGATLVSLVERAGLSPEKLSFQPVRGSRVRGAYHEIGRTIRVRGRLPKIIDFLYLLEQEPHLHRLDNITVSPQHKTNEVDLQVRYMTLVLDTERGRKLKTDQLPTTRPTDLDSEQRELLDAIVQRDLFRPYIQRRVVAASPPPTPTPAPTPAPTPTPTPTPTPAPNPGRFKLVGLPEGVDGRKVLVSDTATGQLRTYRRGDSLAGGTLVMVDYRPLPRPDNPQLLSPSRAIVKVGPDYWAVELGHALTQKHRLGAKQLPDGLDKDQPAGGGEGGKEPPAE